MSTTESVESVESVPSVEVIELGTVLAALEKLDAAELFKVVKKATVEAEKRIKTGSKVKKAKGPKKPTPPQLKKPKAWVSFTLKHAQTYGWEEFIKREKNVEIVMPASVERDGKHVYPNGEEMILAQAMSLSKQRWSPSTKKGKFEALYNEFSEEYERTKEEEEPEMPEVVAPTVVRKTASEKEAETAEKKKLAEEAKAAKKEEREKVKEEAKAAKEAEKEAVKAAKAAAKAAVPKTPNVPKAAVKAPTAPIKSSKKEATLTKAETKAMAKALAQELEEVPVKKVQKKSVTATAAVWTCPEDDNVYPWMYKGTKYLRNYDNQIWLEDADGGCGDWCGVYNGGEDCIDDSVEEPDL